MHINTFRNRFLRIIMVDTYLYSSEILRWLMFSYATFFVEHILRYANLLAFSAYAWGILLGQQGKGLEVLEKRKGSTHL